MSRKNIILVSLIGVCLLLSFLVLQFSYTNRKPVAQRPTPEVVPNEKEFSVTVAADLGANIHTDRVLEKIRKLKPSFQLTLGDLSYDEIKGEQEWCNYVNRIIGNDVPFQIVSGNHESSGDDGLIDNFIKCLPNRIPGVKGEYGKEYYFDYPVNTPFVRFILISPELTFSDKKIYSYSQGTSHFNWLNNSIDNARGSGIQWVVVGMHKDCIHPGQKSCAMGSQLANFLIQKKVDLVLQAHSHVYARTKQLSCIIANERGIIYDEACVVKNSLGNIYAKGQGPAFVTMSAGGQSIRVLDRSAESYKYIEKAMHTDTDPTYGVLKLDFSKQQIRGEFVPSEDGNFKDSFVIKK